MPALPESLVNRYMAEFGLSEYDASVICSDKEDADFFNALIAHTKQYKAAANWMLGPLKFYCRENNLTITQFPLSVSSIAELVELVESGEVSFNNASTRIMQFLITSPGKNARDAAAELNLLQESDNKAVEEWVIEVMNAMPDKVKEYKSGKKGLIGLFSGEVKKRSKGKADMQLVQKILVEKLSQ